MDSISLWFIIGPRGGIYRDSEGQHFCHSKRAGCIFEFVRDHAYGGVSIQRVWYSFEKAGYRCEKRTVSK